MSLPLRARTDDFFEPTDGITQRQRYFAAADRWAHRIPNEPSPAEKRRAYTLMMANLKAGLKAGGSSR